MTRLTVDALLHRAAMDEAFREAYVQGYRHALSDIRRLGVEIQKA